jgi:hypothetical protein
MHENEHNHKILLCGREFTEQELDDIKYMVRRFPKLSRRELSQTICENIGWLTPNGEYKTLACLELLKKLQAQGIIQLPASRNKNLNKRKEQVNITPQTDPGPELNLSLAKLEPIDLEPINNRAGRTLFSEYLERYHYLGYKRPFGSHLRYFIRAKEELLLGCLLFAASAAWALEARDNWIGWTEADRSQRLYLVVVNTRFLIFPWVHVENLASRVLSLAVKRIRSDWQKRYNYQPVLLETFVDTEKYMGTTYRAANWIYLGETTGRGRMDRYNKAILPIKQIYVYPLVKDFRAYLLGKGGENSE